MQTIKNDGYSPSPFEASGSPPAADSNANAAGEAYDQETSIPEVCT